jgi:hypothetical protein
MRLRTRNALNLLGLDAVDWGQSPTEWQRSQNPKRSRDRIMEPVLGPAKPDPGDGYCYLPLYIFCGPHLLASTLRRANIDAAGAAEETARIIAQIRARWPQVRIVLRAASGFAQWGRIFVWPGQEQASGRRDCQ